MKLCQGRFRLYVGKPPEYGWTLEQAPQGSGDGARPARVQEVFGHFQTHGVILGAIECQARSWTSVILVGPFQLRLFYDSMCPCHW